MATVPTINGREVQHVGSRELLECYALFAEALEDLDKKLEALGEAGNIHAPIYRHEGVFIEALYCNEPNYKEGVIVHMEDTWAEINSFSGETK